MSDIDGPKLILPASPFVAPWVRPSWHKNITEAEPGTPEVWGTVLVGLCWLWSGWSDGKGHGKVRIDGRAVYLHRYSWEQFNDREIPCGLHGDHLCRNRPCFNPMHIEPVPAIENFYRGLGPSTTFKPIVPPDDSHLSQEDIDALARGF